MKTCTKAVLAFILLTYLLAFAGCQRKIRPIQIDAPPNRITIGGELDDRQQKVLYHVLDKMLAVPYQNHQFAHGAGGELNYNITVDENYKRDVNVQADPGKIPE